MPSLGFIMTTIYIVPIEPIDSRYTKQWYENIPKLLNESITKNNLDFDVVTIDGETIPDQTTSGAFLDFAATNVYKSSQALAISKLFFQNKIKPGDKFLVTDAWNFAITPIKYMSELLNIPVEIHSIWHAGAYDPTDILGMKMGKDWAANTERGWFYASDYNYYATNFHKDMFLRNLGIKDYAHRKAIRSGQPHDENLPKLVHYRTADKFARVMWPHRMNSDKQPEIAMSLDNYFDVIITQKMSLSKDEYYKVLGESKVIFSCALHENLGISVMEGCLTGAIPVVPDRASYAEMYIPEFKYPSEWTSSLEAFHAHKVDILNLIGDRITNYDKYYELVKKQQDIIVKDYFNADIMFNNILGVNGH